MNDAQATGAGLAGANREEMLTALFAQLVLQQTNMAMMFLGRTPHPQTGETMKDMEAARLFIDELEMLAAKTKGNLSKEEEALLKQSLMSLHLAFVEAVESPPAPPPASPGPAESPGAGSGAQPASEPAPADSESKKKFSKKY